MNIYSILKLVPAICVWFLINFVSSNPTKKPVEEIPQNEFNPLFCQSCTNCLQPLPVKRHLERRDTLSKSYCYTQQYMDRGLISIKRGVIRPSPEDFFGNLHPQCPHKDFLSNSKLQWCFCKSHDCNDVVMEYDGVIKEQTF